MKKPRKPKVDTKTYEAIAVALRKELRQAKRDIRLLFAAVQVLRNDSEVYQRFVADVSMTLVTSERYPRVHVKGTPENDIHQLIQSLKQLGYCPGTL